MITVTDRRRRVPAARRLRSAKLDTMVAFVISRAVWRMFRGRAPWSRGRAFRR
jgi:hypothetical protein